METEHREALRDSEQKLADKNLELAALKAKRRDGKRRHKIRQLADSSTGLRSGVGFVSIGLALVGLGLLFTMLSNWSAYILETSAAMREAGIAKMVGAMITFNYVITIWFAVQSLALLAIGFGQLKGRAWASRSALLWSLMGIAHIVVDVLGTKFIEGQALSWTPLIVLLPYPVFLLVCHGRLKHSGDLP